MRVLPAVDIRGGLCVNLVQGDYSQETVFNEDPVAQAVQWHADGARLIHIVDLDGAKAGRCCIEETLEALSEIGVPYEVGGGIRDAATAENVLQLGAERIVLGTAAHRNPDLVTALSKAHRGRIAVGIDGRGGRVAVEGWTEVTDTPSVDFARRMEDAGATRIIYTDVLSDGMMEGPNLEATRAVAEAVNVPVTASGGVASLEHLRELSALLSAGVDEVIVGRALYLRAFTLPEAMAVAESARAG